MILSEKRPEFPKATSQKKTIIGNKSKAIVNKIGIRLILALATTVVVASMIFVSGLAQDDKKIAQPSDPKSRGDVTIPQTFSAIQGDDVPQQETKRLTAANNPEGVNPVSVTATAGTPGPTGYTTLKDAFDAINAGTHQGDITIGIQADTTETASAVLNASLTPASYTSVVIRPVGAARTISGSIVGAIIRLNGADNVTIDGRIGGVGTNRDLIVRNTNTSTATAAIWLASVAAGNGASNNVIRNLEIAAGATSNTSTNSTFGVIMCGTTISTTSNGVDNDNNQFIFNRVTRARYGIVTRGTTTDLNISPIVTDNIIGPTSFGADQIGKVGILMQADTGATVSRNIVQFVGGDFANTTSGADRVGIGIGQESWSTSPGTLTSNNYTVTKNIIHDVIEERTFSSVGLLLATTGGGSATNNLVANNFIYNVRANGTSGDQAVGLGISGGHTDRVVFNTISMTGDVDPGSASATSNFGSGIRVANASGSSHANLTLMNNNVYMDLSSSSTAAVRYYAISGNATGYSFGTGGENYNNYYLNPANTQLQTGGLGTTSGNTLTTQFAALANWQTAYTTPQDANSVQGNPQLIDPTANLHVNAAAPTVVESAGTPITGVTDDIDADTRNATTPDIGADEFTGIALPANDIAATSIVVPATGSIVVNGSTVTPQASFTNVGSASQSSVNVQFAITGPGGFSYSNMQTIPTINAGQTVTVTFAATSAFSTTGTYNTTATNLFADSNSGNNQITGSFDVRNPLSGSYNVGSGGDFTSLTNPGGIFENLNSLGATGNVTINITSDLTGENGTVALNELAGGFTVTIKPSGASRSITGSSTVGIIRLNGADNVTIDGSTGMMIAETVGGNAALRELTVTNTNTAATAGAVIAVHSGVNGAQNNTIRNVNVRGQDPTQTLVGIHLGGNTVGAAGTDNDGNRVENCSIQKTFLGIYNTGASVANPNTGTVITMNDMTGTGANRIRRVGIFVFNENGIQIIENDIGGIDTNESIDAIGIVAGIQNITATATTSGGITNAVISRNRINGVASTSTTGFSAAGIAIAGDTTGANTISNNMISGVTAPSTSPDIVAGIFVAGVTGSSTKLYHNSVSLSGDRGTVASQIGSYGVAISGTDPTVELKNNIFHNAQTSGGGANAKSYAIGMTTTTFVNLDSNYNDFFTSGANASFARSGSLDTTGTDYANLAAWQTAVSDDANSLSVDPLFVSTSNLHLQSGSTVVNVGTTGTGVTVDLDGQTRDAMPDMGADELLPGTLALSSATYSVNENTESITITVNRTGGTDGAVSVNYTLTDINATGGAACGGSVDYVNTGGTVNLANGQASQTFTVGICNDAVFEGNETFNVMLSGATGGATVGMQSSAVVTIIDDEIAMPGTLALSSATYSVGEAGVNATITVNRTSGTDGAVSVNYSFTDGTATGGAICGGSVDYGNVGGTVNFANGQSSQTFNIPICNDMAIEGDENFTVTLSGATGGATIGMPSSAVVTITDDDMAAGNVVVNPGNVPYMTLGDAIAAINAGTHTGAITVDINANTTEAGPVVLNSSGAGTASYTSIVIRPMVNSATVSGATPTGRGLLELNGADNVTIDGDNPNSSGTNRNLTFQNTAANTVTFTSVIRIALATTVVNSADNNIIRNLNIIGSSAGRNVSTATSTTGTENTTFGIFAGPGASTVNATTPPAAVTSVSTNIAAGATATNLMVSNNSIMTAARAVSINGSAMTVFPGVQINDNTIGNPTAGDPNQVTAIGITVQGSADPMIKGNTIWVEGYVASSTATHAINVGVNSTTAVSGATIERNRVNRAKNNNGGTWAAYGINLGGGGNHTVRNNFVSGVINDQTAGTGGFGTTFGAYGIRISTGTGHKIYHNSVHLYGALGGTVSTDLTAAFIMTGTTQTGADVRNNIFSNQITGGNPTGTRHVTIALPSGGTNAMNLTLNNNGYYQGADALSRMAQVGFVFGTGEFLAENFDPTSTTPATNFRSYTSTLSSAGTNDNASFAITSAPPFVSSTDLHIPAGTATRLESGGAAVGVTDDIDLETRNATTPDIGGDEFAGNPPPPNDIGAVSILTPVPNSVVINGTSTSPQARFTNFGSAAQTNVSVQFTIAGPGGYNYSDMQTIATINPGQPIVVTFNAAPAFTTDGTYNMAATILTADSNPANNQVMGTFQVRSPLAGGTYTVGTGGNYTSLTNPGGIFADLNIVGASGNIVIDVVSDLTGETGAVALNQLAGGFSVTIKPSGAARTISGTAPANTGLIILNGADNVTIDGSLSGGTDRSLTITNNQTGLSTVIWMRSAGSNGANNNTVRNCIINGATGATATTTAGILTGSGVTIGNDAEAPNNNNTIQNNRIYRVQNSMYLRGGAGANIDLNWMVTGNEMGSTATTADKNTFRGMLIGNSQNFTVSNNVIHGIQSTATTAASMSGIQIALIVSNGNVVNNTIHDIKNISGTGTGANAVSFISTSTTSNVTVANNFIYDVAANGSATLASNGFGINVASGAGYKIYHNSVNLNTNQGSGTTAAMIVQTAVTTAGGLDIRNNVFANTQTAGATRYAFYSGAAASVYSMIDYNNYFSTGSVGFLGSARATLADWQTATGQDANSKAVDPLFISATDLHLQNTSPMVNMGTAIAGITTDIDGQTRDSLPDVGADELVVAAGILSLSSPTYTVGETGTVTITVNRVGTMGAVSVNYSLTDGTATGGAACGGAVDYGNTGGTVNFADGESSKTFTVPICEDTLDEANETFNVTLSGATGGAVVGSPSTGVVTITDDDASPGLAINDVSMAEGNAGTTAFTFTVTLSAVSGQNVTVDYATADGTATAPSDYTAASGTVTFAAGETMKPVTINVNGDTMIETNETFFVNLTNATNATISDNQGLGTIQNDDFPPGTLSINDVRVTEGNSGTTTATFTVTLVSGGSPQAVTVDYATANGTATAGSDYVTANGTLTFETGQTTKTVTVTINGDTVKEANETFFVNLINPSSNAVISDGQGAGIIIDEDRAYVGDFDLDRKSDFAVYRPGNGTWYTIQSTNNIPTFFQFGTSEDRPVPGDYDGDGITDRAVWRPSNGVFYVFQSSDATFQYRAWGVATDKPVQGDYNGDGKTDYAVWRPSEGIWYVLQSPSGPVSGFQFGISTDLPVQGDYDGDAKTDYAVFRNGTFYIHRSSDNSVAIENWGLSSDKVVSGDFDGDGKTDLSIFRDGVWWIRESLTGNARTITWGLSNDVPTPADYDGDGTTDVAVFRPSEGNWYVLRSSNNTLQSINWGTVGDITVPSAYLPQ